MRSPPANLAAVCSRGIAGTAIGGLLATAGLAEASAKESKGKGLRSQRQVRPGQGRGLL
ncbi:MAG: hypothetical protein R2845_15085 [Thermomicrobiales bacterium]